MAKTELFAEDAVQSEVNSNPASNLTGSTSGLKRGIDDSPLPISAAKAITTADDTDVAFTHRYLYAGVAGTVAIRFASGGTVYTITVPAGGILPIKVYSIDTASTATGILLFN